MRSGKARKKSMRKGLRKRMSKKRSEVSKKTSNTRRARRSTSKKRMRGGMKEIPRNIPLVCFNEEGLNSAIGILVGYIPQEPTQAQMQPNVDDTCELHFAKFRNFVSVDINMRQNPHTNYCKHLFRETLTRLFKINETEGRVMPNLFRIEVTSHEARRTLPCCNAVLEEIGYSHTMDGTDAQRLDDPTASGYCYWNKRL
jgi:hypothetical protein